jgi:hypothetical protein
MLCSGLLLVGPATAEEAGAQQGQAAAEQPEQAATASQTEAMAILKRMAEFLAQAPQFSVNVRIGYDVVQESGEKVEFGERRKMIVHRPDNLRVEIERSDGDKALVVFDGKDITAYKEAENVYAVTPKPGDIDGAVEYVVRDLGIRVPLAMMFVSRLPAEIERRVQSADYVERSTVTPVPTDHVVARTADVDFQVWIAEGDKPLPQRVVITYKTAEGEPQFWAEFSDWNLNPDLSKSLFAFTPPEGAERIPFLARVRQAAAQKPEAPGETPQTPEATGKTEGEPK